MLLIYDAEFSGKCGLNLVFCAYFSLFTVSTDKAHNVSDSRWQFEKYVLVKYRGIVMRTAWSEVMSHPHSISINPHSLLHDTSADGLTVFIKGWDGQEQYSGVVFKWFWVGTKGPKVCQKNILHTTTAPAAWRVDTRQAGAMHWCYCLYQIVTLLSKCYRTNQDSSDQTTAFQSLILFEL